MYEMVFHGRGGQGAKTAGRLMALSAFLSGYFPKDIPMYGPERTGAPMYTGVRLDKKKVRTTEKIHSPDLIAVYDERLLDTLEDGMPKILKGLKNDGILLINTEKGPKLVWREIKKYLKGFEGTIYTLDASEIAKDKLGVNIPNTAMFGATVKALKLRNKTNILLKSVESVMEEAVKNPRENFEAVKLGHYRVKEYRVS